MMMNLSTFVTIIITISATTSVAATKHPSRARARARARAQAQQRQESCTSKYSIGGTGPGVIAEGKLLYPDSKDQCQYGVELLAEKTPDISIKCCVKKKCGPRLAGVCQNQHKQCKGSFVAGRDTCVMGVEINGSCVLGTATDYEVEIENPCPAAGQCCIPDCNTDQKPSCEDSPGDPCCANTQSSSSLQQSFLADASSSPSSFSSSPDELLLPLPLPPTPGDEIGYEYGYGYADGGGSIAAVVEDGKGFQDNNVPVFNQDDNGWAM